MPLVPQVVKTCDSGQVPSPTPSQFWEPYDNVCINAHVKVRFNNLVDASTINNNSFLVESCDQNCSGEQAIWSPVSGSLYFSFTDGELYNTFLDQEEELNDTVDFWPTSASNLFSRNKWYRVTLTTDIKSMGWDEAAQNFNLAANMPAAPTGQCANPSGKIAAYCFNFKTRDSDTLCQLGSAVVSPKPYTATNFDTTYPSLYSVTGIASDNICWVIDSNPYDWQWNAGATAGASSIYATVTNHKQGTPLRGKPVQDLITKTLETPAIGEKVWAKTISAGQTVSDSAILHISLAPVKVVERWPDCQQGGAACINAAIGARFNMDMDASSLNKTNIILQSCAQDDKCLTPSNIPVDDFTLTPNSQGFGLSYNLAPDQYYQVTIAGGASGVKSAAGGTLKSGFFWIFKTKAAACSVDRVDIYPSSATVYWVGAEALYRGLPFGAKDDCSPVIGQLLDAASYNWSWSSVPLAVATVPLGNIFSFTSSTAVG